MIGRKTKLTFPSSLGFTQQEYESWNTYQLRDAVKCGDAVSCGWITTGNYEKHWPDSIATDYLHRTNGAPRDYITLSAIASERGQRPGAALP